MQLSSELMRQGLQQAVGAAREHVVVQGALWHGGYEQQMRLCAGVQARNFQGPLRGNGWGGRGGGAPSDSMRTEHTHTHTRARTHTHTHTRGGTLGTPKGSR